MRPYAILLLLCALSRAADATRDCKSEAERVIAANGGQQIVYDEQHKRLTCADGEIAPREIEWESTRFKALECSDKDLIWQAVKTEDPIGEAKEWNIKMADAHNPPTVKCVEYCTIVGEGIESRIETNGVYRTVHAKCSDGGQIFINNKKIGPAILCNTVNGLIFYDNPSNMIVITTKIFTLLQAECRNACNHGKRSEGVVSTVNEGRTVIKCEKSNNNGEKFGITVNGSTIYSYLKCDNDGYSGVNNAKVADSYERVNIECANDVTFTESPCSYILTDPLKTRFDSATKTMSCTDEADKLMAIEFNSKRYKSLKCSDIDGWMEGSNIIAEAFIKIEAKCVEYCAVQKLENTILNTLDSGERIISCYENPHEKNYERDLILILNDRPSLNPNFYTVCNLNLGWTVWNANTRVPGIFSNDTTTPARLDCKRACTQIESDRDEILSTITSKRNSSKRTFLETDFTCGKPDKQKYGIRVNKELVYSSVYCNERGFMKGKVGNQDEQIVADPFKPIHLDCAPFPTTTTSTTTTTTTTTTPAPTTSMVPERPTEKAETVPPKKPSKPTGDDDDHPRSSKSSILAIYIYTIILILVGNP